MKVSIETVPRVMNIDVSDIRSKSSFMGGVYYALYILFGIDAVKRCIICDEVMISLVPDDPDSEEYQESECPLIFSSETRDELPMKRGTEYFSDFCARCGFTGYVDNDHYAAILRGNGRFLAFTFMEMDTMRGVSAICKELNHPIGEMIWDLYYRCSPHELSDI